MSYFFFLTSREFLNIYLKKKNDTVKLFQGRTSEKGYKNLNPRQAEALDKSSLISRDSSLRSQDGVM